MNLNINYEEQRKKLLKSSYAQRVIAEIIQKADAALGKEYSALKMSEYMLFFETGSRTEFQAGFQERRDDCSYLSVALWITEDDIYLKKLIDVIFHICDEFTWCLPAHSDMDKNPSIEMVIGMVDLRQAETSRLLVNVVNLVGNKLPYYVEDRIKYEIQRRVIKPMLKNKYSWMGEWCKDNWAAVCAGGTGVAVLKYAEDDEKEILLPILNGAMEHYLDGYYDDGCCLEGPAYWGFGVGYYLIYARELYNYSDGQINLFNNEKLKQIALYPQRVRMGKSKTVSFSDADAEFSFSPAIFSFLKKLYGEEVVYPDLSYARQHGNIYSVMELLWFDVDYQADYNKYLTTFFEKSQWYVKQTEKYSFAAKGGNNGEPHNHNDIGSFMIVAKDDSIPLADLGVALYRNGTFDNNIRYTLINNGSQGHSVPMVNGKTQKFGKEYSAGNVNAGDDFFELNIEGAYELGLIKGIKRKFELKDDYLIISDKFEYSANTKQVVERFVTWTKPEVSGGIVDLKSAKICFDEKIYSVKVSHETYRNHMDTMDVDVYLIDFSSKNDKMKDFTLRIDLV